MLAESDERCCSLALDHWLNADGPKRFIKLVKTRGVDIHEALAIEALSNALIGAAHLEPREVHDRVEKAADLLIDRLSLMGAKSKLFEKFMCQPQPPRHAVYVGESTRQRGEIEFSPPAKNIHQKSFRDQIAKHRAAGKHERESYGVA